MLRILVLVLFSLWTSLAMSAETPLTLDLKDAILLAVRENPNVQQAQLNYVMQKYALEVAKWQFKPHYAFTMTGGFNKSTIMNETHTTKNWIPQPAVTLNTPYGTQIAVNSINSISGTFNPGLSLQIVQPLIRGFGRPVVEASLHNAMDSEYISRLNVEGALRTTVTTVINAYLDVVSAINAVEIDKQALSRAKTSVQQTKLFIKSGRKAGVELVTVEADVANSQTRLENDKNSLDQARYALLTAIGIDPNTKVNFNNIRVPGLIEKYHVPTLEDTKHLTLENDIPYQAAQIMLHGATRRNVLVAKDNTRWQLNLTATGVTGNGTGGGPSAGISSLVNGINNTESLQLNLVIPIDDKNAKQALLNAKIGLQEAEIALRQEKWAKETTAINGWNTINSAERAMRFAESAEMLQAKTYKISFQKYSFGLIDSVELQSVQQQLIDRQQSLLSARINYLKALVNLDQQIGHTLKTWGIEIRCCAAGGI